MDNQIILACDDNGKFTGEYIPKEEGHTGEGKRHLAITVLLYNSKGEVLLQKRKHRIFDDIWDFTGATHPLHLENGHDETFEEATLRCLKREYDINPEEVTDLSNLGTFNYFASYKDGLCENEHCAMLVSRLDRRQARQGEYNGEVKVNPEIGYSYKWMKKQEFLKDIQENPQSYSPWAVEGVKILQRTNL